MSRRTYPSTKQIRQMAYTNQIRLLNSYFWYRLEQRELSIQEVDQALHNCEIIEVLWRCKPLRILVNGYTLQGKALHIALAVHRPTQDDWWLDAVTVYEPDPTIWETPEKRRETA